MANISIQLPIFDAEHKIEIEVKVNGAKKKYHYRVELFEWDECADTDTKAVCLKNRISDYDKQWRVVQIGSPGDENIPVMFKQEH